MSMYRQIARCAALACCGILSINTTFAQVSSINSGVIQSRVFNDVPGATFTGVNSYPGSISLSEAGVSAATGFANRDVWRYSNNGTTPYSFQHNDYFNAQFTLNLTASPTNTTKEAGFLFSSASLGDIQLIVKTDNNEVVQFGGVSFYSYSVNNNMHYFSGDTITLGMSYFLNGDGRNALQFFANGVGSPIFELAAGADIGDGSTLGGYLQIVNDPAHSSNSATALFSNISISSVPEPSAFALLGLGAVTLFLRRRRA